MIYVDAFCYDVVLPMLEIGLENVNGCWKLSWKTDSFGVYVVLTFS